jgi:hydrogenase maturation protein HypF
VREQVNYEAQAAIELEALVDPDEIGAYTFDVDPEAGIIGTEPLFRAVVKDLRGGVSQGQIAARFHNGLAAMVVEVCRQVRKTYALSEVVLSGGVWQNLTLLGKTLPLLEKDGFVVYTHQHAPTNDGGLALGQAVIAGWRLNGGYHVSGSSR